MSDYGEAYQHALDNVRKSTERYAESKHDLEIARIREAWSKSENQHELIVVPEDEMSALWVSAQARRGRIRESDKKAVTAALTDDRYPANEREAQRIRSIFEDLLGVAANAPSAVVAARLAKDFQGFGDYRVRSYQNRRYIIFKGNARTRSILRGTRYRLDNPKIVSLGIGTMGAAKAAAAGARVSIVLFGAYRVGELLLEDEATLSYFFGSLATDIAKAVAGATAAYGAGYLAAYAAIGGVVGPIVAAVFVGVVVGLALSEIDRQLGTTDQLVATLQAVQDEIEKEAGDGVAATDRAVYNFLIGRMQGTTGGWTPAYR